mgnify:CR=1 FL=1
MLFSKQITVRSGAGEGQHQNIIFNAINQKPVRLDMTLPMPDPITRQCVVFILFRKRFTP